MITNFKDFLDNVIVESLHPELQDVILGGASNKAKQTQLANKIKELKARGETTGIEGNMPTHRHVKMSAKSMSKRKHGK